jgi:hypothetical protein
LQVIAKDLIGMIAANDNADAYLLPVLEELLMLQ